LAVDGEFVFEVGREFAAGAQVIVEREHGDGGVASVAPLRAATVFDEPVADRFDELVCGIDGQQRAQGEGGGFDSAVGPAPIDAVLAPVRGGDGGGRRGVVDEHGVIGG